MLGMQAEPSGGGHLLGAGRLWIAPEAETDDRAVRVPITGKDLPTESLVRAYLPQVRNAVESVVHTDGRSIPSRRLTWT